MWDERKKANGTFLFHNRNCMIVNKTLVKTTHGQQFKRSWHRVNKNKNVYKVWLILSATNLKLILVKTNKMIKNYKKPL